MQTETDILHNFTGDFYQYFDFENDSEGHILTLEIYEKDNKPIVLDGLLSFIGQFKSLEHLRVNLKGSHIGNDLSPLSGLTNLEYLSIKAPNSIVDLFPLCDMAKLEIITIENSAITDLSPITGLKKLISVNFTNAHISDLSPLSELPALAAINLSRNGLNNIQQLSGFKQLNHLTLSHNNISDFSPIKECLDMKCFYADNNPVEDISFVSNFTGLIRLGISDTKVRDLSFLLNLTKLISLNISNSRIKDISYIVNCRKLQWLRMNNAGLQDISAANGLNLLEELSALDNPLINLEVVGLSKLVSLHAGPVESLSVASIVALTNLKKLTLRECSIKIWDLLQV